MTLLIGTISKRHIVITADGLSLVNPTTCAGVGSETVQKIFPVPNIPVAFVHHGLNILDGNPVGQFIGAYIETHGTVISSASIKEIAEDLRSYSERPAQITLADPTNSGVVGFWVAGFSPGKRRPELYEVCWPDYSDPLEKETMVLGGGAQQFIKSYLKLPLGRFSPNSIGQSSVGFVRDYHEALYNKAKDKQDKTGQNIFGGHQHQLVLEESGWRWTKPPK